jgi:uncharacterized Zn finger protein
MLQFTVNGSSGDRYEIVAERRGDRFCMSCTCEAGRHGTCCKHRFALLDGEFASLLSANAADIERLRDLVRGTEVERQYHLVCALEREKQSLDIRLKSAKKALARNLAG